jgi:PadR family transcriptional regulator, regulatory protein PadR
MGTFQPAGPSTLSNDILLEDIKHMFNTELKRGSIELLIMALLEERPRHGYEIGKLIERRSEGRLSFSIPALYPTLCRLEDRGWIKGRWVEKPGERRRRFFQLTPTGRAMLARERENWQDFIAIMTQLAGLDHA